MTSLGAGKKLWDCLKEGGDADNVLDGEWEGKGTQAPGKLEQDD